MVRRPSKVASPRKRLAEVFLIDGLSKKRREVGVAFAEHGFGGFPVDAAVGDGDAVFEVFDGLGEGLVAEVEVTFDHCADDAGINQTLAYDFGEDFRLATGVFGAIGVAAVRHDGGDQAGLGQFFAGLGDIVGPVVGAVGTAAQHDVAVGVAFGRKGVGAALIVDAEKSLWLAGGFDRVDRHVEATVGAVFEAERHGEAGGHLSVRLALGSAGADRGPRDQIGDVLRGDRVE